MKEKTLNQLQLQEVVSEFIKKVNGKSLLC